MQNALVQPSTKVHVIDHSLIDITQNVLISHAFYVEVSFYQDMSENYVLQRSPLFLPSSRHSSLGMIDHLPKFHEGIVHYRCKPESPAIRL